MGIIVQVKEQKKKKKAEAYRLIKGQARVHTHTEIHKGAKATLCTHLFPLV